jgi:predicted DNA-binding transcriptional regulator AlpA
MERLLTIKDVTEMVCLSYSTLHRQMKVGAFPQPVNGRGRKLLWTKESIETWTNRQEISVANMPVASTAAQQRRKTKDFLQRQEAAKASLAKHQVGRKK